MKLADVAKKALHRHRDQTLRLHIRVTKLPGFLTKAQDAAGCYAYFFTMLGSIAMMLMCLIVDELRPEDRLFLVLGFQSELSVRFWFCASICLLFFSGASCFTRYCI